MSTIDQKAYLQKYLGGSSSTGDKKKKKKKSVKGKGLQIIVDDLDLTKMRSLEGDEIDMLGEGEDAPQVAGIIDERPEELRNMELFKTTSKWRVISQDDGFNSNLKVEEIKKTIKETQQENTLIFGKMFSDSEDEKKGDSNLSPPRKPSGTENLKKLSRNENKIKSSSKCINNSDSDFSPPRKNIDLKNNSNEKDRRKKPSRWGDSFKDNEKTDDQKNSRCRSVSSDISPPRKRRDKNSSGSDESPPRRKCEEVSRKLSPRNMKSSREHDSKHRRSHRGDSPGKYKGKHKRNSDSDLSPPRKSRKESPKRFKQSNSPPRKSRLQKPDSDSDLSPPRKNTSKSYNTHRSSHTSSQSNVMSLKTSKNMKSENSDSDLSPPRKNQSKKYDKYRNDDSPPPSNKKMAKTLEGRKAGLQSAKQLREENDSFRRKEDEVLNKMTDEVSGRNAQVVSRRSGKRETSEERRKEKEKAERQKELDEKYKKWGKGLKQIEDQEKRIQEYMEEASKPFARHKDDSTLDGVLKDVEREGDPMLQYMREKKKGGKGPERPTYKGNYPPNRFNIRPGYRWDGVDRSNGYEKKLFQHQSMRKAQQEEAYKWSTEDL